MRFNIFFALLLALLPAPSSAKPFLSNSIEVGDGLASNKQLQFRKGASSNPVIQWNNSVGALQFANDGSTFKAFNDTTALSNTVTQYGACYANTTTSITTTAAGTAGYPLVANSAAPPSFQPLALNGTTQGVTGVLQPANLSPSAYHNWVLNAGLDFWQRGTAITIANTATAYLADRWWAKNTLGTNGVLNYSQNTAGVSGSSFGIKIFNSTAPTASQANGLELGYTFDALTSLQFYTQTVSLSTQIKAVGNVNSVTLYLVYLSGSEAKATQANAGNAGTINCTVNSSTFTLCSLPNISLGTLITPGAGVYGIEYKINTVSTGNTYDINNGIIVEQPMLNIGSIPGATFVRAFTNPATELSALQRYYWKATGTTDNYLGSGYWDSTTTVAVGVRFPVKMRAVPSMTISQAASDFAMSRPGSTTVGNSINTPVAATVGEIGCTINLTSSGTSTVGYGTNVFITGTLEANAEL